MDAKNKLNKKIIKIVMTMMLAVVFLIGEIFSPLAVWASAKNNNGNSTQDVKIEVVDYDTQALIRDVNITFNKNNNFTPVVATQVNSTYDYTTKEMYNYMAYNVNNGRNVTVDVDKYGYEIYNMYKISRNRNDWWCYEGKSYTPYVINPNTQLIKIELKKTTTTSNDDIYTTSSKPQFTVTMDSYTPTNPSVGDEITFNGTIHPQDFEMPIPAKEIVLVLDSSGSMSGTKIEKLKDAAKQFITKMKDVKNLKIGIVDFDTQATIKNNLIAASNVSALNSSIDNLSAGGGTNTGEGLRQAAYLLSNSPEQISTASKTIVFMSDGEPTYYNSKNNQYYTDITQQSIENSVQIKGSGSSDVNSYCLNYAKTIGAIIKEHGYNAFSIGYGLDNSGTAKMQQIHDSMSSVSSNFFESDTDSIDSIFDSIANTILDSYPINNINFNFNPGADTNIESVDGNTISLPDFNYKKVDENSSTVKYTADPVSFSIKVKSNVTGNNIPVFTNSTVTFPWKSETITSNVPIQYININSIDNSPPDLTLTPSTTESTSGTVEITATASDDVAVASITTPDNNTVEFNPAVQTNSTTYTATINGEYTFKAADTAGNVTTKTININNIVSEANVASKPQFTVTMDSYTPINPSVGDEITFNGTIHPQDFEIQIPEKEIVLVLDSSGSMGDNSKLTNLKIAAKNFIEKMKDVQNLKIGIVDFDTQAVCGSSLIDAGDVTALNSAIDNLHAGGGTNTGEGLRLGAYLLSNSPEQTSTASKTIVFMSDGEPTYYNKKGSSYYIDITKSSRDDDVVRKGTGSSDNDGSCLDYAKTVGAIIKEHGYNAFSIGYGLNDSGTVKMEQIHNSMSSVSSNFFESDTGSIDSVFNSIANTILSTYPITDIKFNFNPGTNTDIESVDGNILNIPNLNYTISSQTSSKVEYTAEPVQFTVKIKSNVARSNIPVFTNSTVTFPWKNEIINADVPTQYINVGNIGSIDTTPPGLTLTPSTTSMTKGPIIITATASDSESGVASITKPDGTVITDSTTTYTVSDNGTYEFTAIDNAGNVTTQSITISNIDNTPPTLTLTPNTTSVTKGPIIITATASDSGSGVASITKPDSTVVTDSTITYTVSSNGTYTFRATDKVGNVTTQSININNIDNTPPVLTLTQGEKNLINGTVIITATASDSGSGVASIKKPDDNTENFSTYPEEASVTYTVSADGTYTFTATDKVGNSTTQSITISSSSVLAHGLYNGNGTDIVTGNGVTVGIPVTLAMIVDVNSSNPVINLSVINDTGKISVTDIVKKYAISYDISSNGTIDKSSLVEGTLNNGKIDFTNPTMGIGEYMIVYTITPNESGTVTLRASADGTEPRDVTLNIGEKPDLF